MTDNQLRLLKWGLLASLLLQKIAVPGTGGIFTMSLIVLAVMIAAFVVFGMAKIDTIALVMFLAFLSAGAVSIINSPSSMMSVSSFILVTVIQSALLFRMPATEDDIRQIGQFVVRVAVVFSFVGVLQYALQFVLGPQIAFFLDFYLPDGVLLKGFNVLNPLYYESPIYKTNGFVFLEASFFNQFLSLAVAIELVLFARLRVLVVLGVALIFTYSGTGITMLALFVPYVILRQGRYGLLLASLAVVVCMLPLLNFIDSEAIFGRLGEFSDKNSSGYARFFSPFALLSNSLALSDLTALFGRGPGTINEKIGIFDFTQFDPTWGKVAYEYGMVGGCCYFLYIFTGIYRSPPFIRFPGLYTFLILGGYLANPYVVLLLCIFVIWLGEKRGNFAVQRTNVHPKYPQ